MSIPADFIPHSSGRARPGRTPVDGWLAGGALLVICGVAAMYRFGNLASPGLWFDEILGTLQLGPEHGPFYYATMRATRVLGTDDFSVRLPFAIAGLASVLLLYFVVAPPFGRRLAVLASALMSLSPIHIYYSREARPYAFLILWVLVGLAATSQLRRAPDSFTAHLTVAGAVGLLVTTSLHAAFYLPFLLLAYVLALWDATALSWRRAAVVAVLAVATGLTVAFIYREALQGGPVMLVGHEFSTAGLWRFAQAVVAGHSEQHPVRPDFFVAMGLALLGAVSLVHTRPLLGGLMIVWAVAGTIGPILTLGLSGHFVTARFALAGLPAVFVLLAAGADVSARAIEWLLRTRPALARTIGTLAASLVALAIGYQPAVIAEAVSDKPDWKRAASVIAERAQPGDTVVAASIYAYLCLQHHLAQLKPGLNLHNAESSPDVALRLVAGRTHAFLARRYEPDSGRIDRWMDGAHLLWSTHIEGIRVYFYPDEASYLTTRLAHADLLRHERSLWGILQGQLLVADEAMPFLLDGWGALEKGVDGRQFRWAEGGKSRLYVPVVDRPPARLQLDVTPFRVLPALSIAVRVDGMHVADIALPRGNSMQDLDLSKVAWPLGGHIIELVFSATARPSDHLPPSPDTRALAALFRSIRLR